MFFPRDTFGRPMRCFSGLIGATAASPAVAVLVFALITTLVILRNPARLLHPQFFAEDGYIFFQSAWERGFFPSVIEPYSGYLHLVPRLVAGCALLVPLAQAPLVFNLAALLIMLLPVWYLLSNRMRSLPSFSFRVGCAVLFALMPASKEIYVNITNAHWYLMFAACFALAAERPARRRQLVADTLVFGLFALSSPLSVVFLPVVAARAWLNREKAGPAQTWLPPAVLALGCALQAISSLADARVSKGLGVAYEALPLVKELAMFGFYNVVLGVRGNQRHFASLDTAAYLLGAAALIGLAVATIARRSKLGILLLYAAAAVFIIEHAFPLHPGNVRGNPGDNTRYYVALVYFTLFASFDAAVAGGLLRYAGAAILSLALLVGIPGDFRISYPDTNFIDQELAFRARETGVSFAFPLIPDYSSPMVLTQKGRRQPQPLLQGRSCTLEPVQVSVNLSLSNRGPTPGTATHLEASGTAYGQGALKAPGTVLIAIDEQLFPAVTIGRVRFPAEEHDSTSTLPGHRQVTFLRSIPVSEIGPGPHHFSVIVMTDDRQSYYQPAGQRAFTLP